MRNPLKAIVASFFVCFAMQAQQLPAWEPGFLDIHHIQTGRGDCAFAILPDGTTLLIDAGEMSETHKRTTSRRNAPLSPNNQRKAHEWIVDYVRQFHPSLSAPKAIDYALITHYHDDHFGEVDSLSAYLPEGYVLTGITGVGHYLPLKKLIDRGFAFPIDLKDQLTQSQARFTNDAYGMISTLKSYWNFIDHHREFNGLVNEPLRVGYKDQIRLNYAPHQYPEFSIYNLASNGIIATGYRPGDTFSLIDLGSYPGENPLSNAIRIDYGRFNYYTGGDIAGIGPLGEADPNSVEAHLAPVVGPVDIAVLNHHGNRDSQSAFWVRTLRPRVWIQQNWTADHPGEEVLRRMQSQQLYPGKRSIFSTVMLQGAKDVIGPRLDSYASQKGHIVVRVYPKTYNYRVYVLDDEDLKRSVKSIHGPYESR